MYKLLVADYIVEIVEELKHRLEMDQLRWGDTWKNRPREGQEERAFARYVDYLDQFRNAGTSIPWLKVIGEAMICWIREKEAMEESFNENKGI